MDQKKSPVIFSAGDFREVCIEVVLRFQSNRQKGRADVAGSIERPHVNGVVNSGGVSAEIPIIFI